jgi:hypothetical protein
MVRRFLYIALLFLIVGCQKTQNVDNDHWIVVNGVLKAGSSNQVIQLQFADEPGVQNPPVQDAQVIIKGPEEIVLVESDLEPGMYVNTSNVVVQADQTYDLEIRFQDQIVSGTTQIPRQLVIEQVSSQLIPIDPDSEGQPIFSVLWESSEEYSYVLTLENVEASPEEIPFTVPAGQFDEVYNLPIPSQGATLYDTDFTYYGDHILTIYAITKEYEEVFFYSLDFGVSQLTSGPDNIQNGSGFFTGVSLVQIPITLVEM